MRILTAFRYTLAALLLVSTVLTVTAFGAALAGYRNVMLMSALGSLLVPGCALMIAVLFICNFVAARKIRPS